MGPRSAQPWPRRAATRKTSVTAAASQDESPISIDLLDVDDRILTTHHAFPIRTEPGGCGCHGGRGGVPEGREPFLSFVEANPLPEREVARISFHTGDAPLLVVEAGNPPHVAPPFASASWLGSSGPKERQAFGR